MSEIPKVISEDQATTPGAGEGATTEAGLPLRTLPLVADPIAALC